MAIKPINNRLIRTMKKIFLYLIISIFALNSFSQSQEIGLFLGTSYYLGDLNRNEHIGKNNNPAFGVLYKLNHRNNRYSLRLQFLYGKIEAYDFQSKNEWQQNRNLNFSSNIFELGAIFEVSLWEYEVGNVHENQFSPFLFIGVSGFNFKPKGRYNGNWYELQPLGTEGQGTSLNKSEPYKLNQLAIPMGIGYKSNITSNFSFSIEWGARLLFTDYLDDVSKKYVNPTVLANEAGILTPDLADRSISQLGDRNIGVNRGNSNLNDWYFFTGFTFTYSFGKIDECGRTFRRKR